MLLSEILEEIAERYPHSLTNASVVRKLNDAQNLLFRTEVRRVGQAAYDVTAGTFLYTLPFPYSNLISVVVNDQEYRYQDPKSQNLGTPFYYFTGSNGFGLYPTPTESVTGGMTLFYNLYPVQLSASMLTAKPDLDENFHMLLVYYTLAQIASIYADVAMVNNFASMYEGLLSEFRKVNDESPENSVIQDVMGEGLY